MSTVKFDTWQNTDGTENYKCRAWANVSGDGTASIRASGGVSSLTDNGTGDYTLNLSITLPDTNGAVVSGSNRNLDNDIEARENSIGTQIVSTTAVDIVTGNNDATTQARDYKQFGIAIFR